MHQTATAEGWYPEHDELPPRPRARLLTPLTVLLMLALFAACGFVGGVLVEKQQQPTATVAGAAASARLGAGAGGATGAAGATGAFGGRSGSLLGGGASRATIGTVTNIDGRKLFVTTAAGTMVEVLTTPESKINKSVSVGSNSVHPGDSVVVSGIKASNGTVTASSVSDSGSASSASGISSLFGAGGTGTGTGSTTSSGGSTSLFGG
jgi:hypothetical protein